MVDDADFGVDRNSISRRGLDFSTESAASSFSRRFIPRPEFPDEHRQGL